MRFEGDDQEKIGEPSIKRGHSFLAWINNAADSTLSTTSQKLKQILSSTTFSLFFKLGKFNLLVII